MSDIVQWADILDKAKGDVAVTDANLTSSVTDVGSEIVTLLREIARNTSFLAILGRPIATKMKRMVRAMPMPVQSAGRRQQMSGDFFPVVASRGGGGKVFSPPSSSSSLATPRMRDALGRFMASNSRIQSPAVKSTSQMIQESRTRSSESKELISTIVEGNKELVNAFKQSPKSDSWIKRMVDKLRGVSDEKKKKGYENIGTALGGGYYEAYQEGREAYRGIKEDYTKFKSRWGEKREGKDSDTAPGGKGRDEKGRFASKEKEKKEKKESAGVIQRAKDQLKKQARGRFGGASGSGDVGGGG